MSGRKSRSKGRNGEYKIRDYFRKKNYISDRVPGSGAFKDLKGDVSVNIEGRILKTEVKFRQNEFKSIYAFYDKYSNRPCLVCSDGCSVLISHEFDHIGFTGAVLSEVTIDARKEDLRTMKKLFNLEKLLKTCDFLSIIINYKQPLFLRFIR